MAVMETGMPGVYNLYLNNIVQIDSALNSLVIPVTDKVRQLDENDEWVSLDTGLKGTDVIIVVVAEAADVGNLVIKAGTGLQGTQDLTLEIKEGVNLIRLETGKYVQTKTYLDEGSAVIPAGTILVDMDNTTMEGNVYVVGIINSDGSGGAHDK